MALLFMDSFDAGDYLLKWTVAANASTTATTRFNTGKALYLNGATATVTLAISPTAQVFTGFAITVSGFSATYPFISIYTDSGATLHLNLRLGTLGAILLYLNGTQIATSANGIMTVNSWAYLEMWSSLADTGGRCIVKANGATVIDFTGDTRNAGTSTNIDAVKFGGSGSATSIDDFYICDASGSAPYNTFLGEVRVFPLTPNGAGSSTQFTPSTGANYTTVDELPYSATDYVSSGTTGQRDTYTLTDLPATTGTIYAIQNNVIAKKTDAATIALKSAVLSGAGIYYGAAANLSGSDTVIRDILTADPATSVSWTASGVNSLEAGFEVA